MPVPAPTSEPLQQRPAKVEQEQVKVPGDLEGDSEPPHANGNGNGNGNGHPVEGAANGASNANGEENGVDPADRRQSSPSPLPPTPNKTIGTVKWFNCKRNFGFIKITSQVLADGMQEPADGENADVFLHGSSIMKKNPRKFGRTVDEGEVVEFDLVESAKGREAIHVTGLGGQSVKGSRYDANRYYHRRRRFPRSAPRDQEEDEQPEATNQKQANAPETSDGSSETNNDRGPPRKPRNKSKRKRKTTNNANSEDEPLQVSEQKQKPSSDEREHPRDDNPRNRNHRSDRDRDRDRDRNDDRSMHAYNMPRGPRRGMRRGRGQNYGGQHYAPPPWALQMYYPNQYSYRRSGGPRRASGRNEGYFERQQYPKDRHYNQPQQHPQHLSHPRRRRGTGANGAQTRGNGRDMSGREANGRDLNHQFNSHGNHNHVHQQHPQHQPHQLHHDQDMKPTHRQGANYPKGHTNDQLPAQVV